MQQEPHGSCGPPEGPPVPGLVKHPGAPARCVMVRQDAESSSARGEQRERKPLRRSGKHVLRRGLRGPGTTAVEPGRAGSSICEPAELPTSYSSEFEVVEQRGRTDAADTATCHGPTARKGLRSVNPRSGSGPSESARPEGEQAVEGAKDPEDGQCRVWQARVLRIPPPMSLKGRETPGGAIRSVLDRRGHRGPNPERETKPAGVAVRSHDRADGRMAEHLVVVETTRRRRRTNDAATPCGALREAGQP
jgi:hypothetical protein